MSRPSAAGCESTGDFVLGVFGFFAEGQQGEEFVAAGDTTEGGDAQRAPERSDETVGQFRGDTFYFDVAADAAVRGEQMSQRSGAGTEALGTTRTAPRNQAYDA